ncbi:hypothetical protein BO71DRAFT_398919 [Aspergillus ellipticus CBS 707.79]|uniref:NAD(P)-binding protein n=1 Tax=Aspergillus ellipticus CBS 707.79 TaxID=1448320 RepID=A0A319DSW6_9EURO|nr:hypothetical protein BO71DRAFT_398919 [Aspergillus ellipticus CBS 707.79]
MVPLSDVQSSIAKNTTSLPEGLVALFVGGTNGVGEITLKQLARHAKRPRIYFVGRSQEAGTRIAAECKVLNPEGQYIFISADASLLNVVDEVCRDFKRRESALNFLFLSMGTATIYDETSEGLRRFTSLLYYGRIRFIVNLLPLLQRATGLRRVISVGSGGYEGPIDTTDLEARQASIAFYRGHVTSITTLALERLADQAPTVSFINTHPGTIKSGLMRETDNFRMWVVWFILLLFGRWIYVPHAESGERNLFLLTSARYPPRDGEDAGVPMPEGMSVARGCDGERGSGVYSVIWTGETPDTALEVLAGLRKKGMREMIWRYTESQFKRVTGAESIE